MKPKWLLVNNGITIMKLASLVNSWDDEYERQISDDADLEESERRPYSKMLDGLHEIAPLRFQPYQNDLMLSFMEKLRMWLSQFKEEEQPIAFLVAMKLIFVTQKQLEVLSRRLFEQHIRRRFLEAIIRERGLKSFDFTSAMRFLGREMDKTLFIPNSDSSNINAFVHVNSPYFKDRTRRRLTGPEVAYWVHPVVLSESLSDPERAVVADFQGIVANKDKLLKGKKRLVVIEDFSGTGSDLKTTLRNLSKLNIEVSEVIIGVLMATQEAVGELKAICSQLSSDGRRLYDIETSMVLPQNLRCFNGPEQSYLESNPTISGAADRLKTISEKLYRDKFFSEIDPQNKHGFGGLALAFAFYTNCPDNSLPMLWTSAGNWHPLFPRSSRVI
jgi:hypothetical protein